MSNLASNCDDSFYQPPFSNLLQAADPSSRFWNYAGDHGLKQLPETSHDALTNLTVPSNPSNYPYAQPSVYPSYDPVHSSNSIPSTSRDPHVLATPSRGGNNTTTFGRDSHFPNDALSELYRIIKVSSFVLNHQLEPVLSSEEGRTLVKAIFVHVSHLWTSENFSGESDWLRPFSSWPPTVYLPWSGCWLRLVQEEKEPR